jgi:prophage antirepressor-like protein
MQFLGPSLRKNNTKLGTKVNVYLEREKQSQQITNLKKLTNITNIKNPEKNMFINKLPDTLL